MIYLLIHIFLIVPCYVVNRKLTIKLYPGEWTLADRVTCIFFSAIPVINLFCIVIRLLEIVYRGIKIDWFKEVNW